MKRRVCCGRFLRNGGNEDTALANIEYRIDRVRRCPLAGSHSHRRDAAQAGRGLADIDHSREVDGQRECDEVAVR